MILTEVYFKNIIAKKYFLIAVSTFGIQITIQLAIQMLQITNQFVCQTNPNLLLCRQLLKLDQIHRV